MRLVLKTRHLDLTDDQRALVHRRILSALARVSDVVRAVDVTVGDVNGPRGGIDKLCRIRVRGLPAEIVVEQRDADVEAAVTVAAARVARTVLRQLDRRAEARW